MRIAVLIVALAAASPALASGDRYGPNNREPAPAAPAAVAVAAGAPGAPAAYSGPMLGWSRKAPPRAPAPAVPAMPQRLPDGLYAGPAAPPAPPRQAALPDSLYSRPAGAYASAPRFYSVYREYGGQPDPLPPRTPGSAWAHRPEASLIDPPGPPRKKKGDDEDARMAAENDGDWGAGLMGGLD